MSSRFGPRAMGTDGTDFKHRQRIATHYHHSAQYKIYLKVLFGLHFLVLLIMWVKVGGEVLVEEFGIRWPFYQTLQLPNAYPWEYVWCFSFIPLIFAVISFKRNKINLLRNHYYGQFIMGILPCSVGIGGQLPELIDYLYDMKNSQISTFRRTFPMTASQWLFENDYGRANNVIFINFGFSLFLINELHLKLEWKYRFSLLNHQTRFILSPSQVIQIQMITRTANFPYYEDQNVQVVSLPLQKSEMHWIAPLNMPCTENSSSSQS
ncbi:Protein jagunal [Dirofilaria immitis]|nr:Protein jagunal [Dirofilaria immitis]